MIPDHELIRRATEHQDRHAFSQLVLRYQSALRQWSRRLCNGDAALADDLAQETFIKAWVALKGFRVDARFSTWLYRIAFNTAANRWRRKDPAWCSLDELPEEPVEASSELARFACNRDLGQALLQLSTAQQLALRLCFDDGFSHEEAALIMGVPLGTLKAHVARGKQKLHKLLQDWQPPAAGGKHDRPA